MSSKPYLEYEEYLDLGGKVSEDAFCVLERKARRWLDYYTFNRIPELTKVPDIVKEVMVEFIDKLEGFNGQTSADGQLISKYSNGVEDITYRRTTESEIQRSFAKIAIEWLPDYLVNRSLNFNVRDYLQSDDNNLE